jgi:tRNA (Thr-GGU) A37 N-methylase
MPLKKKFEIVKNKNRSMEQTLKIIGAIHSSLKKKEDCPLVENNLLKISAREVLDQTPLIDIKPVIK